MARKKGEHQAHILKTNDMKKYMLWPLQFWKKGNREGEEDNNKKKGVGDDKNESKRNWGN